MPFVQLRVWSMRGWLEGGVWSKLARAWIRVGVDEFTVWGLEVGYTGCTGLRRLCSFACSEVGGYIVVVEFNCWVCFCLFVCVLPSFDVTEMVTNSFRSRRWWRPRIPFLFFHWLTQVWRKVLTLTHSYFVVGAIRCVGVKVPSRLSVAWHLPLFRGVRTPR